MTWIGAAILVLSGIMYIWQQMAYIQENTYYWQGGMALVMVVFWGTFLFWVMNKARVAEFMIATEAEMKKVNWPSRKEVYGSTIVVIGGTILMAILLFLINLAFGAIFTWMGVLQK